MKKILRYSVIAAILIIGAVCVTSAPKAVRTFLPKVDTIRMAAAEYRETVSGTGVIGESGGKYFVKVYISERDVRKVKTGQKADVIGSAFDDGVYTATVTGIENEAVRKQGEYSYETMVEVTLKIDNPNADPDNKLRSGYTSRAEIKTGAVKNIYIIPYYAVCQDDAGEYVYVLSGNTVKRRGIVTGTELADGVQVTDGLGLNDEIIANPETVGNDRLAVKNNAE